jgi:hypothetical protein
MPCRCAATDHALRLKRRTDAPQGIHPRTGAGLPGGWQTNASVAKAAAVSQSAVAIHDEGLKIIETGNSDQARRRPATALGDGRDARLLPQDLARVADPCVNPRCRYCHRPPPKFG